MEIQQVDVILIGSGQGAVPLAQLYAEEGKEVVLFERAAFGGTCVNYGCLPSKAFLASAHAAANARNSGALGIHADVQVDFPAVMQRARKTIQGSSTGVKQALADADVQIVEKAAAFLNPTTVYAGEQKFRAPITIINTGKSPAVPPLPGLDEIDYLTYQNFWELEELPKRTLVLGGGYVGVELGQGLARLGSEIHIVEREDRLVEDEDPDVSRTLTHALEADGVHIATGTEVTQVHAHGNLIEAQTSDGRSLEVDALLVATGRKPNTDALAIEQAAIETDRRGHILVNPHFGTTNPAVYAIGDVIGQPAFTHMSWEDHRRLHAILEGEERHRQDRVLAYAFFTEPQVGRVGLTETQAQAHGHVTRTATIPLTDASRAGLTNHDLGFYRMVVDADSHRILGATLVGPQAGEVVQILQAYMESGATWHVVEQAMHVHPTYAEALPGLARQFC